MKTPDITVLIPSFNKAKYVRDAVDSVLAQTYSNFQLWIIENSTHKPTRDLVLSFADLDPRLTIFTEDYTREEHIEKHIHPVIMNKYWELADTEFVTWIADDDTWYPDLLLKLREKLINEPNLDAAYCAVKFVVEDKYGWEDFAVQRSALEGTIFGPEFDPPCGWIDTQGSLIRRKCLGDIEQPWWPEDWENFWQCDGLFLNKLAAKYRIAPIPEILALHRCTPLSYAQSNTQYHRYRDPSQRIIEPED